MMVAFLRRRERLNGRKRGGGGGGDLLQSGLSLSRLGSRLEHVPDRWLHHERCVHAALRLTSKMHAQYVDAGGEAPLSGEGVLAITYEKALQIRGASYLPRGRGRGESALNGLVWGGVI